MLLKIKHFIQRYPELLILFTTLGIYFPVLGRIAVNGDAIFMLKTLLPVTSLLEYLELLVNFKTIDFQPVRDATFFLDFWIYRATGIVTFATTNVLLWAGVGILFYRIVLKEVSDSNRWHLLLWTLVFLAYPLSSQAVPWGMARKHVLAIFLILLATNSFLDEQNKKRHWIVSYILYVLACLSHPLMILWPCWRMAHSYLLEKPQRQQTVSNILYGTTLLLLLLVHYKYHSTEHYLLKEVFLKLPSEFFDLERIVVTAFFDLKQLFLPYELGFLYYPTWKIAWPGIFVLILLGTFLYQYRRNRKVLSWMLFACIPLPIALSLPGIVYDQYLLLSAIGFFIIAASLSHPKKKYQLGILILLLLGWGFFTHFQARMWVSHPKLAERNFNNAPSCKSAMTNLHAVYSNFQSAPPELLKFVFKNHCLFPLKNDPPYVAILRVHLHAEVMFYEDILPLDKKLEILTNIGKINFYPLIIKAILLTRAGRYKEAEDTFSIVLKATGETPLDLSDIFLKKLGKLCRDHQLSKCQKLANRVSKKSELADFVL